MLGIELMGNCLKTACALSFALMVLVSFSGCGGGKPVPEAKKAVKAVETKPVDKDAGGNELGSERYLPREERLRRRQEMILSVLDRFGSAPLAAK